MTSLVRIATVSVFLSLAPAASRAQTTVFVNGVCGDDGWSGVLPVCAAPDGPKRTIQAGIDTAADGDTVLVADGVYTGGGNRDLDFGGRRITVRGENGPTVCIIDVQGSEADPHRGATFRSGETADSVLEGFTIRNGYNGGPPLAAGGIHCESGSGPTIRNCTVTRNTGSRFLGTGGGISCFQASPVIEDCTISHNEGYFGGGILSSSSAPVIRRCRIVGNLAEGLIQTNPVSPDPTASRGGGVFLKTGGIVEDCIIVGNVAAQGGGVMADGDARIRRCVIASNRTFGGDPQMFGPIGGSGGGVQLDGGLMSACIVVGNAAPRIGGGVHVTAAAIDNCLIAGNSGTGDGGGGMSAGFGGATPGAIRHCTVVDNSAVAAGGGVYWIGGAQTMDHCVVWGNTAPAGPAMFLIADARPNVAFCNTLDGPAAPDDVRDTSVLTWGGGNIDADPRFVGGPTGTWTVAAVFDPDSVKTTLTDAAAALPAGQLAGLLLRPNASSGLQFVVAGNTATTITVWGDASTLGGVGAVYQVHDYHLTPGSSCVDTGNPAFVPPAGETDLDGEPRVQFGVTDIGADESTAFADCNGNGVSDTRDVAAGTSADCNGNFIPDDCDIAGGTSPDVLPAGGDGVPDECQADCNTNGVPDNADIAAGTSRDCNGNGVPDECIGSEADCNGNGVPDACDVAAGTSPDADGNTVPDECQATLHVPAGFPTIQAAIDAAEPGDTVLVADGFYSGPGNVNLDLHGKILAVRSQNGPQACVIDAGGAGRGFVFQSGESPATHVVEGFTVTGGGGVDYGGGMYCVGGGSPTIENCRLTNNAAENGGGLAVRDGSRPVLRDIRIVDNSADPGQAHGVYCTNGGGPQVEDCEIAENDTEWHDSDPTIEDSRFTNSRVWMANRTTGAVRRCRVDGGGVLVQGSAPALEDTTVTASNIGGAAVVSRGAAPTLTRCVIQDNPGIGMQNDAASEAVLVDCRLSRNGRGGMTNYAGSRPTLIRCVISENRTAGNGGGMTCAGSDPTLLDCVFSHNTAGDFAGGIFVGFGARPRLVNTVFVGNTSPCDVFGGVGGVALVQQSELDLVNCTASGNQACDVSGIASWHDSTVRLQSCTLARNASVAFCNSSIHGVNMVTIENSVLWANGASGTQAAQLCSIGVQFADHSCIQGWNGSIPGVGNFGDDPQFASGPSGVWTSVPQYDTDADRTTFTDTAAAFAPGALVGRVLNANTGQSLHGLIVENTATTVTVWSDFTAVATAGHGYEVFDYHLGLASPCTDAGNPDFEPAPDHLDVDGEPRILGCRIDVGVDEVTAGLPNSGDMNGDSRVDAADAPLFAAALIQPSPTALCIADLNVDGRLNGADLPLFVEAILRP